jgi:hypothetical protein
MWGESEPDRCFVAMLVIDVVAVRREIVSAVSEERIVEKITCGRMKLFPIDERECGGHLIDRSTILGSVARGCQHSLKSLPKVACGAASVPESRVATISLTAGPTVPRAKGISNFLMRGFSGIGREEPLLAQSQLRVYIINL